MRNYNFTITGNHESHTGNPIPKIKKTFRQKWTPEARRYSGWKCHVQGAFMKGLRGIDYNYHARLLRVFQKPIKLGENDRAVMDIKIFWRDDRHGDPENVFGSIADALFYNDKYLDGSFVSELSREKFGHVEVGIKVYDNTVEEEHDD